VNRVIVVITALLFVLACQAEAPTEGSAMSSTLVGAQPLHFAAADGDVESVELLLDRGAKINAATEDGWTALHFACLQGDEGLVQLLLDRGADVSMTTATGLSASSIAMSEGDREIVELLLDRGASASQ
jgi:ankyrin repeat protein